MTLIGGGEAGFDPAGFQISAVMNTADGFRIPLWTKGIDDGGGNPLGAAAASAAGASSSLGGSMAGPGGGSSFSGADLASMDLPVVESVSVELSLGLVGKITVDIAATYDTGLKLLDSPFFAVGNVIEVQIGYPRSKRFTLPMSAITAKPSIRVSPDEGLTATINGEGGGFCSLRSVSNETFEGMSYSNIITEIAARYDWDVELPGGSVTNFLVAQGIAKESPFDKEREVVSQSNMTDWHFIQHLCYSSGCNAFMGPSDDGSSRFKLTVKERKEAFAAKPKVCFRARGESNFQNVFPALEFESEAEFVWLPGGAVKTTTCDISMEKEEEPFEAVAETSGDVALGDGGSPKSISKKIGAVQACLVDVDGPGRTGDFLSVSCRDPRGPKEVAQSHRDQLAIRGGVTASVTSFGVPELLPGDVAQVDTMGVFNGLYGINLLTHTANDTEWTMRMELINNAAASGIFQKYFVKQENEDNTNTETVDEENPDAMNGETPVESVVGG